MKDNLARISGFDIDTQVNESSNKYSQLKTHFDKKYKTGWYYMQAEPRSCFTSTLLKEISNYQKRVQLEMQASDQNKYDFLILASEVEGVFNLGGDLAVFFDLIRKRDKNALFDYAVSCINVLYQNIIHLDSELTTIALVQGDALGGGFEAALSSNVLIAERGSKLGLPEVLFNLFPGMGAYSLLSRKVSAAKAEEIILSGKLYLAEDLYEMGIIDILAEKGEGEIAVYQYIKSANRKKNSYQSIRRVRDICNTISYQELLDITKIWVESALKIAPQDLRMMERLVIRQTAKNSLQIN